MDQTRLNTGFTRGQKIAIGVVLALVVIIIIIVAATAKSDTEEANSKKANTNTNVGGCFGDLNGYQLDGKNVVCPPGYAIDAPKQPWGSKGKDICTVDDGQRDCGLGGAEPCKPTQYSFPSGEPWPYSDTGAPFGKPLGTADGSWIKYTYPNSNGPLYLTNPVIYDSTKHCA